MNEADRQDLGLDAKRLGAASVRGDGRGAFRESRTWRNPPVVPMTASLRIPSLRGRSRVPAVTATDAGAGRRAVWAKFAEACRSVGHRTEGVPLGAIVIGMPDQSRSVGIYPANPPCAAIASRLQGLFGLRFPERLGPLASLACEGDAPAFDCGLQKPGAFLIAQPSPRIS